MKIKTYFNLLTAVMIIVLSSVVLLVIALTSSCTTTKYVPVETVKTDTLFKARKDSIRFVNYYTRKDSVHVRDSVSVRLDPSGNIARTDTWHLVERFKSERDSTSFYKALTDSLKNKQNNQKTKIVTITQNVPEKYPFKNKLLLSLTAFGIGFILSIYRKTLKEWILRLLKGGV